MSVALDMFGYDLESKNDSLNVTQISFMSFYVALSSTDNTDNTTIEPITITKTTTIITRKNNGKDRGRGFDFNSPSKGCVSSAKNNCSLSNNNKTKMVGELKIYGTQSSAIQGFPFEADNFRVNFTNFMKEQLGNTS